MQHKWLTIFYVIRSSPLFQVFSGPPTGLTQMILEAPDRPNIKDNPGLVWHNFPNLSEAFRNPRTTGISQKQARHSVANRGCTAVQIGGVQPILFRQVVRVGASTGAPPLLHASLWRYGLSKEVEFPSVLPGKVAHLQ